MEIGDKICLWQEEFDFKAKAIKVLKEVIVTITETKVDVPGEFSGKPCTYQSLRGIGDDAKEYEKHWDYWPEAQTRTFTDVWSMRDDGIGKKKVWIPKEAVHAYGELVRVNKKLKVNEQLVRIYADNTNAIPKGDVTYCEKHDEYTHKGQDCFYCLVEKQ
jgi:hypothetical protein